MPVTLSVELRRGTNGNGQLVASKALIISSASPQYLRITFDSPASVNTGSLTLSFSGLNCLVGITSTSSYAGGSVGPNGLLPANSMVMLSTMMDG